MKPEAILQSDVLDILFEGKNKEYGAYSLRKNYNKRLIQALGATCLLVALFTVLQSMVPKNEGWEPGIDEGRMVNLPPNEADKPKEDKPKEKIKPAEAQKPQPTIQDVVPVIKPDVETTVVDRDSLEGRITSNVTNDLPSSGGGEPPVSSPVSGTGSEPVTEPIEEPVRGPLMHAEIMPSFNGDLRKFMLKNIRQPNDLDDGDKIVVKVKFVVTETGEISSVEIVQSGRRDLDEEVMRVVKKMPRWRPGMQGGRSVPVYFQMPVTFVSNAE